jgi:hypothetical protein
MNGDQMTTLPVDAAAQAAQRQRLYNVAKALQNLKRLYDVRAWGLEASALVFISLSWLLWDLLDVDVRDWLGYLPIVAGLTVYALVWLLWRKRSSHLRRDVSVRIRESELVPRIADGWDRFPVIHEYTPWYWRPTLGRRPATDSGWGVLIAENIDWYMRPPRQVETLKSFQTGRTFAVVVPLLCIYPGMLLALVAGFEDHGDYVAALLMSIAAILSVILGLIVFAFAVDAWRRPVRGLYIRALAAATAAYLASQFPLPSLVASTPPAAPPSPPG